MYLLVSRIVSQPQKTRAIEVNSSWKYHSNLYFLYRANSENTPSFSLNVNSSVITISVNADNMCLLIMLITNTNTWTHTILIYWYTYTCVKKISAGLDSLISSTLCPWASLSLVSRVKILCPLLHHHSPVSCHPCPCPQNFKYTDSKWDFNEQQVFCRIKSHQFCEKGKLIFFPEPQFPQKLFTYQGYFEDQKRYVEHLANLWCLINANSLDNCWSSFLIQTLKDWDHKTVVSFSGLNTPYLPYLVTLNKKNIFHST